MRTISPEGQAALASGRFGRRVLVTFDMPEGVVGLWDDIYDISYGGVTYGRAAGAIRVGAFGSGGDNTARAVTVELSGLNPDIVSQVEGVAWHQRPITVREAILDADSQIVHVETMFAGFIDQLIRRDNPGKPGAAGLSSLQAVCESIQRELGRRGARSRTDTDQRQIDSTDGFLRHQAATANSELYWGRLPAGGKTATGLFRNIATS